LQVEQVLLQVQERIGEGVLRQEELGLDLLALVAVKFEANVVLPNREALAVQVVLVEPDGAEHVEIGRLPHPVREGDELGGRRGGNVNEAGGGHCEVVGAAILWRDYF